MLIPQIYQGLVWSYPFIEKNCITPSIGYIDAKTTVDTPSISILNAALKVVKLQRSQSIT